MKRLKLTVWHEHMPTVPSDPNRAQAMLGRAAKLFDADTGDELEVAQDITVNMPMSGIVTVDVRLAVAEIEILSGPPEDEADGA